MDQFVVQGKDGKPVFIGREDPKNPPVRKPEGSKMTCKICGHDVDYLVGEDTNDGGRQGCEACWKPSKRGGNYVKETGETEKTVFN